MPPNPRHLPTRYGDWKVCPSCRQLFRHPRKRVRKYCSEICRRDGLIRSPHTEETKKKMSEVRKQRFASGKLSHTGPNNPAWRGGIKVNGDRRMFYIPEHPKATKLGYVYEHRLVAEQALGRPLETHEVAHHHPTGELVICTQSYHVGIHNKLGGGGYHSAR